MRNDENNSGLRAVATIAPIKWLPEFDEPIREFAGSEMFSRLFKDGMALVEETASYLDAAGDLNPRLCPARWHSPMPVKACD